MIDRLRRLETLEARLDRLQRELLATSRRAGGRASMLGRLHGVRVVAAGEEAFFEAALDLPGLATVEFPVDEVGWIDQLLERVRSSGVAVAALDLTLLRIDSERVVGAVLGLPEWRAIVVGRRARRGGRVAYQAALGGALRAIVRSRSFDTPVKGP